MDELLREIIKHNPTTVEPTKTYRFAKVSYNQDGGEKITIDRQELINLILEMGYQRLKIDGKYFLVKVENNLVYEVEKTDIIDAVQDEIMSNEEVMSLEDGIVETADVFNTVLKGVDTYFSESMLLRLRKQDDIEFVADTKDKAYFFFKNGLVEVTKNDIRLKKYADIGSKKIWKNTVLNRDFKPLKRTKYTDSYFAQFCKLIAQNNRDLTENRVEVLQRIIGYCLHRYYNYKLKAIIFTDSRIDEMGEANGRTGKTLLCKAIGKMLNVNERAKGYLEINGKDFKPEKEFKYQQARPDTKLIHINDAKRNFDIEVLFNDITEMVRVERKGKDPFLIKVKFILSSNSVIKISGSSAKDRTVEFEFADYFTPENSPDKVFGHWFFDDWNNEQWNEFDNFMLECVQLYLIHGLPVPKVINLNKKKQLNETSPYFVEFIKEREDKIIADWQDISVLFREFKDICGGQNKYFLSMGQRTFTKWIKKYCEYSDRLLSIPSNGIEKKAFIKKSNGSTYIKFQKA